MLAAWPSPRWAPASLLPTISQAAFIEDSKASVELRNFYMNRDFRQEGGSKGQSKAEEWAQGFLLRYESGYTEGTVGFGVDAIGTLGLKLDSGGGTSGTGLLQRDRESSEAQDSYGDLGVTAKVKLSNSVLKAGTLMPKLPVLMYQRLAPAAAKLPGGLGELPGNHRADARCRPAEPGQPARFIRP